MRWRFALGLLFAVDAFAQVDDAHPGLAVFDLKGIGTQGIETQVALNSVVKGLRELDVFEVLSSEDVRQLLSIERQKQMLGIESDSATLLSVQALGVKHFVVGSVTRTGPRLMAELRLLDSKDNRVVAQRTIAEQLSLDRLAVALAGVAQELVGSLLIHEEGRLLVHTREEGAEVLVDDLSRGSTPLPSPITLSRGRHRLIVKKDGFVSRITTVAIKKGQLTVEDVTLVPSADYVAAYQSRNRRLRMGAYLGLGAAVVGFVGALTIDRVFAENLYQNEFKPRLEVLEAINAGRANDGVSFVSEKSQQCFANPEECRSKTRELSQQINLLQVLTWVGVGVGALGVIGATYCFLSGEDPNRYAQLVAAITPEGGSIGLVGRW